MKKEITLKVYEYFVFCFDDYYPSGGMGDYDSRHETLDKACERASELTEVCENIQIWNFKTLIEEYHWEKEEA